MSLKQFIKAIILTTFILTNPIVASVSVQPLETARLILRPVQLTDVSAIGQIALDPAVLKLTALFPTIKSDLELTDFVAKFLIGTPEQPPRYPLSWAAVHKETQEVIGLVVFCGYNERHVKGEIAYAFNPTVWNHGYATEAVRAVIGSVLAQGLQRVSAVVDPANLASKRVLQKVGMTYEGLMQSYYVVHGQPCDRESYAIIALAKQ